MEKLHVIEELVNELVGKKCWSVVGGAGTGTVISLHIGELRPREKPLTNPRISETTRLYDSLYSLMVYSPWRVDSVETVWCGSFSDNSSDGPYRAAFEKIEGQEIKSITVKKPAYDMIMEFENQFKLNVFCSDIGCDNDACYVLGRGSTYFTVCYEGKVLKEVCP